MGLFVVAVRLLAFALCFAWFEWIDCFICFIASGYFVSFVIAFLVGWFKVPIFKFILMFIVID